MSTARRVRAIVEAYHKLTPSQQARVQEELGVSDPTDLHEQIFALQAKIISLEKQAKAGTKRGPYKPTRNERIKRLREEGKSYAEIAYLLSITTAAARKAYQRSKGA